MKPVKLVMSAFGPYKGRMHDIDFEKFEENGVFLITGDTGAGKTTIFDAVCFALFGTVSGTYRDTKNLRSEYADNDTETFVEFTFTHQGRTYMVRRNPSYMRPAKKGNSMTEERAKAALYEDGRVIADGIDKVNDKVKECLGVDDKQFKQIAMIAQGEFWKLLNASTDDRTKILRTIFMTDGYSRMSEILKDRVSSAKKEKEENERSILQYFNDVEGEGLEDLKQKALESKSAWNLDELLLAVGECIETDEKSKEEAEKESKAAGKEFEEAQKKVTVAEQDNRIIDRLNELKEKKTDLLKREEEIRGLGTVVDKQKKASYSVMPSYRSWKKAAGDALKAEKDIEASENILKDIEGRLGEAKVRLIALEEKKPEAEERRIGIRKLEEDKEKYSRRDELRKEYGRLLQKEKELEEKVETNLQREAALKEKEDRLNEIKEELKDSPAMLAKEEARESNLSKLSSEANGLLKEKSVDLVRKKEELEVFQESYGASKKEYDKALEARLHMEAVYEAEKAGILAQKLSEGEKCPVCGSLHHPEPAVLSSEAVTEEQLKKAKEAFDKADRKKNKAFTEARACKSALEEYERNLEKKINDVLSSGFLCGLSNTIEAAVKEIKDLHRESLEAVKSLIEDAKELADTEKGLKAAGIEKEELSKEKKQLEGERVEISGKLASLKTEGESLAKLPYGSLKEAEERLEEEKGKLTAFEKNLESAEKEASTLEGKRAEAAGSIKAMKEGLDSFRKEEGNLRAALDEKLKEYGFDNEEVMVSYAVTDENIKEEEAVIQGYREEVSAVEGQLAAQEKEASGKEYADIEALKVMSGEKKKSMDHAGEKVALLDGRIRANIRRKSCMEARQEALLASQKEHAVCYRLYGLVSGTRSGEKITLEQYVQAAGFDRILRAANRRLLPMSDGQFELYRSENRTDKRSASFLNLEVQDNYTGKRRPVGNLSGGESFKASLSLALGLSDTVSSSLGGLQMDALFVDEGFGTLDRKSIDNAMDIIMGLSKAGRLVGIISHREELASQINQQIRVTKDRDGGSTIGTYID